jgi:endonuclease VIII
MPEVMGRAPREDRHGGEVYVYRRAGRPCYLCGAEVLIAEMQGRKLYWCPACQPG